MFLRTRGRAAVLLAMSLGLAGALSACGSSGTHQAQAAPTGGISAVAAAAKGEGSLTWYTSIPQAIATAEAQAFQAKYGVTVKSVVLTSGLLTTRFSSEKEAGNSQADVLTVADSVFMNSAVQKKWLATLSTAQLPALGAVPAADIHQSAYVLTGTQPIGISYNTAKLKASQVDSWQDLLSPALKGQLYVVNPADVPSWLAIMDLLRQKYGPSFLKELAAAQPRFVDSSVPGLSRSRPARAWPSSPASCRSVTRCRRREPPSAPFFPIPQPVLSSTPPSPPPPPTRTRPGYSSIS